MNPYSSLDTQVQILYKSLKIHLDCLLLFNITRGSCIPLFFWGILNFYSYLSSSNCFHTTFTTLIFAIIIQFSAIFLFYLSSKNIKITNQYIDDVQKKIKTCYRKQSLYILYIDLCSYIEKKNAERLREVESILTSNIYKKEDLPLLLQERQVLSQAEYFENLLNIITEIGIFIPKDPNDMFLYIYYICDVDTLYKSLNCESDDPGSLLKSLKEFYTEKTK